MKCYGEKSTLDKKFLNKIYTKEKLKRILVNSLSLFNCKIVKWYYYLIFYYNPKESTKQLKYELFKNYSSSIECLFYNPVENVFYSDYVTKIDTIPLSKKADLDYNIKFLFNQENYNYKYKMTTFDINQDDYYNYLYEFIEKFQIIKENDNKTDKINLEEIINQIKNILKIEGKEIYYESTLPFKKNYISYPSSLNIYIYKKKDSDNFFAIMNKENDSQKTNLKNSNNDSNFIFFDLEKKEEVNELLIDLNSKNFYCLSIEKPKIKMIGHKRKRPKNTDKSNNIKKKED